MNAKDHEARALDYMERMDSFGRIQDHAVGDPEILLKKAHIHAILAVAATDTTTHMTQEEWEEYLKREGLN